MKFKFGNGGWQARIGLLVMSLLPISVMQVVASPAAHAFSTCTSNPTANSLRISPAHGQVFYIDSGVTPKVDAAYVGYRINNTGASARSVWVQLSNFTGGKVGLANPADASQSLVSIAASDTKTAFFLLKATGASLSAQGHLVTVYDRRPDLTGAQSLLSCSFSFAQVQETIKASANKINKIGRAHV